MICEKIGADRVTVHPGWCEMPAPAKQLNLDALVDLLGTIVDLAEQIGVSICLENFESNPIVLCGDIEEYSWVLSQVKGLCSTLDIGHANVGTASPINFIQTLRPLIKNMHIHDNSGGQDEHLPIGMGNIDYQELLSVCKQNDYWGPFTLEVIGKENILKCRDSFYSVWQSE